MTEEQAMGYKSADGKPMDWKRLDADADGRVSQTEWTGYHSRTVSDGSKDRGADERAGAAGPSGGVEASGSAGAGSAGTSTDAGVNRDAPKDSDPTSGGRGSN